MNIKQKLTWAFAVIASLPILVVATLVVLNLRTDARESFIDGSNREIRQVANAMQLFLKASARTSTTWPHSLCSLAPARD